MIALTLAAGLLSLALTDTRTPPLGADGSCLRLANSGTSQNYLRIPVSGVPQAGTTVSLWFRMDPLPPNTFDSDNNPLFAFEASDSATSSNTDREISVHLGAVRARITTPNGKVDLVTDQGYRDGQWHHVAHTLGPAGNFLYVDGVLLRSSADKTSTATGLKYAAIGRGHGHAPPWAVPETADIDEVRVHTTALTQAQIRGLMDQEIPASTADLFAYWRLEDSTIRDEGPHHWPGVAMGPVAYVPSAAPIYNRALRFDGADDHVIVPGGAGLGLDDGWFTAEAWIFPTDADAGTILNNEGRYSLRRKADGRLAWSLRTADLEWDEHVSDLTAPPNKWTHVALTYSPALMRVDLYANGVAAPKVVSHGAVGDAVPAYDELTIGSRGVCPQAVCGGPDAFAGLIDEVRVWGARRTQTEIQAAMRRQLPGSTGGLRGYWQFNELTGATAHDSTQEGAITTVQPGTLVGPQRETSTPAPLLDIP
jgi:hypothetical protein